MNKKLFTGSELARMLYDHIRDHELESIYALEWVSYNTDERAKTTVINHEDFEVFSRTDFGSSEGVYTTVYLQYLGEEPLWLIRAKTLSADKAEYMDMHHFGATVSYYLINIRNKFPERFRL